MIIVPLWALLAALTCCTVVPAVVTAAVCRWCWNVAESDSFGRGWDAAVYVCQVSHDHDQA